MHTETNVGFIMGTASLIMKTLKLYDLLHNIEPRINHYDFGSWVGFLCSRKFL